MKVVTIATQQVSYKLLRNLIFATINSSSFFVTVTSSSIVKSASLNLFERNEKKTFIAIDFNNNSSSKVLQIHHILYLPFTACESYSCFHRRANHHHHKFELISSSLA